jgi:16S rRNA (guanine966-N2)-methyltransferase
VAAPVERWLAGLAPGDAYDLAFCDPPYAYDAWDGLLSALPAALVVVESDRPVAPPPPWELVREARYGGTWVGFATAPAPG